MNSRLLFFKPRRLAPLQGSLPARIQVINEYTRQLQYLQHFAGAGQQPSLKAGAIFRCKALLALASENLADFTHLISDSVLISAIDTHGNTLLHLAIQWQLPVFVEYLLGLIVQDGFYWLSSQKNHAAQTPLQLAVQQGDLTMVKGLIAAKADHLCFDLQDNTLLHLAVQAKQPKLLAYLCTLAIPLQKQNIQGETAWDLAVKMGENDCMNILQSHTNSMGQRTIPRTN